MGYISPSKEELLASINPNMHLTRSFLKRVYGYSVTEPDFADRAIIALEQAGCTKARQYYDSWVTEYEAAYNASMREVSAAYRTECEKAWENKKKEVNKSRAKRQKLNQNSQECWAELSEALGFPSMKKAQ